MTLTEGLQQFLQKAQPSVVLVVLDLIQRVNNDEVRTEFAVALALAGRLLPRASEDFLHLLRNDIDRLRLVYQKQGMSIGSRLLSKLVCYGGDNVLPSSRF